MFINGQEAYKGLWPRFLTLYDFFGLFFFYSIVWFSFYKDGKYTNLVNRESENVSSSGITLKEVETFYFDQ